SQKYLSQPQGGHLELRPFQTLFQLGQEGLEALDGPRNDGREEDAEDAELEGVRHRLSLAVVNVGQVMHEFESEEGKALGHGSMVALGHHPSTKYSAKGNERAQKQGPVLKEDEPKDRNK